VSFGGAGGLHVCALAEALEMREALVPVHAGVLSALGMLASPPGRQLSRTLLGVLTELPAGRIADAFDALAAEGRASLVAEGIDPASLDEDRTVDLRYLGQSYTLNVPWSQGAADAARTFEARHEERYGHRLDVPLELVNLRVGLHGMPAPLRLDALAQRQPARPAEHAAVAGCTAPVPVFRRGDLAPGQGLRGPAVVTETVATTWLAPGWECTVDRWGNLSLRLV
jgi:N-methylhydantoinase A